MGTPKRMWQLERRGPFHGLNGSRVECRMSRAFCDLQFSKLAVVFDHGSKDDSPFPVIHPGDRRIALQFLNLRP